MYSCQHDGTILSHADDGAVRARVGMMELF
jgi:hypothetical protein